MQDKKGKDNKGEKPTHAKQSLQNPSVFYSTQNSNDKKIYIVYYK